MTHRRNTGAAVEDDDGGLAPGQQKGGDVAIAKGQLAGLQVAADQQVCCGLAVPIRAQAQ